MRGVSKFTTLALLALLTMIVGAGVVGTVVATEPNEPPNMDVQIKIWTNQTHVLVYVNGVPLNDRIDSLQMQYDVLSNHMKQTDANIYDYITLNEMKSRLIGMHQWAVQGLQRELLTNQSLTNEQKEMILNEIAKHNAEMMRIQSDADNMLINILMKYQQMLNEGEQFSYGGYHDIYDDFHYFKEASDEYMREEVFRITDCYSDLGQSKVLQGGWITIKGINSYGAGVSTTRGMWITYLDPATGITDNFYVSKGSNIELPDYKIKWDKNVFEFSIKIDRNTIPGMKQVTFKRESPNGGAETIKVVFDVVRPELRVYSSVYEGKIAVTAQTNLDKIKMSYDGQVKDVTTQFGRAFAMFNQTNATTVTVSGTGDYNFVEVQVTI